MKLLFIIAFVFLIVSCSPEIEIGRTILISVASDYSNMPAIGNLMNTLNDQAAIIEEFRTLDENIEIHMFRTESARSYYSTNPVFGNELESTKCYFLKEDGSVNQKTTMRIPFYPGEGETIEKEWTIYDVIALLANLDAKDEDLIIFHYSGHGDNDGSLVVGKIGDMFASIKVNEISYFMSDEYQKGTKLLLLDSCYSGSHVMDTNLESSNYFRKSDDGEIYQLSSPFVSFFRSFSNNGKTPGRSFVLAASRMSQMSYDAYYFGDDIQRYFGFFTYHLLTALGYDWQSFAGRRKGRITLHNLYKDIWREMESEMLIKATPTVTLSAEDVVLFY